MPAYRPITPAELDWQENMPISREYHDIYFSREGGAEESRHVFLQGNQLPQRWRHRSEFTIAETGFGCGLNFLCTLAAWSDSAPRDARLHYLSLEKYPLTRTALQRVLSNWPELTQPAAELINQYPPLIHGYHRREFLNGRVTLILLFGDATSLLADLHARVDAWYLDGFAPHRNPEMWSDEIFRQISRLTKLHGTFATFTAAGAVKRGLQTAGFKVNNRPGFGRKRDMLCGTLEVKPKTKTTAPWFEPAQSHCEDKQAVVIGAGMAGITASHALARRGWNITLIERHARIAQEASGNLAGVVMPRLTADMNADGRFYLNAFLHSTHWLNQLKQRDPSLPWFQSGVLQLCDERQQQRMQKLGLSPEVLEICDAPAAGNHCGINTKRGGIFYPGGGWLDPPALCQWLLDDQSHRIELITHHAAISLKYADNQWTIIGENGTIASAATVIIANAYDAQRLLDTDILSLHKVRGQLAYLTSSIRSRRLRTPVCHDGYIIPAYQGLHCAGASYDLEDESGKISAQSATEIINRLKQELPEMAALEIASGRVAFRTSTRDHLPIIGPVPDIDFYKEHYNDLFHGKPADRYPDAKYLLGLYISTGHGSRGLVSCHCAADIIADQLSSRDPVIYGELSGATHAGRFLIRSFQRNKG